MSRERSDLRVTIVGPCASGKTTLRRALEMHGYAPTIAAQEHSSVPGLWKRSQPEVLIALQASLEAVRLRRSDPRWSAAIWRSQQGRLADAFAHADLFADTSSESVDHVVGDVLEFLNGIMHDSSHDI